MYSSFFGAFIVSSRVLGRGLALGLAISLVAFTAQAQVPITGTVTDASGAPLVGASVQVKELIVGGLTDAQGQYSIVVRRDPPFKLIISYIGFSAQEVLYEGTPLTVALSEDGAVGEEVVVAASRIPESQLRAPVTIERLDQRTIRETPSANFFDALNNVKGVDLGTQSLTYKSFNMRGFGANGNTRIVQQIDGVDNMQPGLGLPFGNLVGVSELDVANIEILPGASSVLYGPNALNGVLITTTKDPFFYKGASAQVKYGFNHFGEEGVDPKPYYDVAFRYAGVVSSRFAYKVNFAYLDAEDWYADDYTDRPGLPTTSTRETNTAYNGINTYGDEASQRYTTGALAGVTVSRTGYTERELAETGNTNSLKAGLSLHYRITDAIEASVSGNYGTGNSIYTAGGARTVLQDYERFQIKAEIRGAEFFLRAYTTQVRADETYSLATVANTLNQKYSTNANWFTAYSDAYNGTVVGVAAASHTAARVYADRNRLQPGSARYNTVRDSIKAIPTVRLGARTIDKSNLYQVEGMYNLSKYVGFAEVVVGGNFRRYDLNSEGTLFLQESPGEEPKIDEYGLYAQVSKSFWSDRLKLTAASRYDKNENFEGRFTPRFTAVVSPVGSHTFRASFQTAFRTPSAQNQFVDFSNTAGTRQLGGVPALREKYDFSNNPVYTQASVNAYRASGNVADLVKYNFGTFKTEKVQTIEIGYKTILFNKLFVDAYYYRSVYTDFVGDINVFQPNKDAGGNVDLTTLGSGTTSTRYTVAVNNTNETVLEGWALGLEYAINSKFSVGGNVAYNKLSEFTAPAGTLSFYNTPDYRTNLTFTGREVLPNTGFSLAWRWQDAFYWESGFAVGTLQGYQVLDAQVSYNLPKVGSIIKLGAANLLNNYYTQAYGNPQVGGLYYVQFTFDELLRRK